MMCGVKTLVTYQRARIVGIGCRNGRAGLEQRVVLQHGRDLRDRRGGGAAAADVAQGELGPLRRELDRRRLALLGPGVAPARPPAQPEALRRQRRARPQRPRHDSFLPLLSSLSDRTESFWIQPLFNAKSHFLSTSLNNNKPWRLTKHQGLDFICSSLFNWSNLFILSVRWFLTLLPFCHFLYIPYLFDFLSTLFILFDVQPLFNA